MKERQLKYLNDKVIKKALSKETKEMRQFVARIISRVTNIPEEELEHLELLHPEMSSNANLINSALDVIYKEENLYFSIEINYGRSKNWKKKNLSYIYQLSLRDLKTYKDYETEKKVIQININGFDSFGKGDFLYKVGLYYEKYQELYSDAFTIYEINLEYYKKLGYNDMEEMKSNQLLKELAFLVIEDKQFLEELYEGDALMENVQREMKGLIEEVDGILYYDEVKLQQAIEKEMREEGLKEGIKEGIEKGLKEGIEKGQKEKQMEIAKAMVKEKMEEELILKITGISKEQLEEIKKK